jgi:hypothetical protein
VYRLTAIFRTGRSWYPISCFRWHYKSLNWHEVKYPTSCEFKNVSQIVTQDVNIECDLSTVLIYYLLPVADDQYTAAMCKQIEATATCWEIMNLCHVRSRITHNSRENYSPAFIQLNSVQVPDRKPRSFLF